MAETRSGVRRAAIREAIGLPSLVLGASFLGFGSLVREAGLDWWHGLFSTITAWALPGQIVLIELYGVGASTLTIALAVALTNARLFPMTLSLVPHLRRPGLPEWAYYALSHLIAVTGWAHAMRKKDQQPVEVRDAYLVAFAGTIWLVSMATTVAGYFVSGMVPRPVALGLVFLSPVYFLFLFAADARTPIQYLGLGLGLITGPLFHLWSPDWGLLAAGVVSGTVAFMVSRHLERRRG